MKLTSENIFREEVLRSYLRLDRHTTNGALPFHRHIGPWRHKETHYLHERPIVFTTYATVAAEFRRGDSALARVNWFRIVLDEGI
jgi:SWI/SNF-related matrix-associated actin-dependent regulator of chromatin subfamily A3